MNQFQAILNPAQAAILATGRIKDRVVAEDGHVVVRPTMYLTLSVDHRIMDGAQGARFWVVSSRLIESQRSCCWRECGKIAEKTIGFFHTPLLYMPKNPIV